MIVEYDARQDLTDRRQWERDVIRPGHATYGPEWTAAFATAHSRSPRAW
ncbi:MAG: hypothetical protein ACR2LI_00410 [Propionibacteriaceae bacterium]